jgi:hypothetical protein
MLYTFAARVRPFREISTPTSFSSVVGCSNNESRRLPDPQPKSTWKCTFTMRNLIIFINKGQEDEG